jgi:E2F/DP family winged-helix DNA-binding domain
MLYPCYPMQQPTSAPHGNFGMVLPTGGGRLPPTPVQSYVTPTPHKKPKLEGDAPPSLPYHAVPPPTYSHVKAPPPPKPTAAVEVKPVEEKYNRKNKSLGVLAETFLRHFTSFGDGHEIVVDQLAAELAVERRRIYDVVNILESLQVVVKVGKNTYHWMGREHLMRQFALLQQDGIGLWPDRAAKAGLYLAEKRPAKDLSSTATDGSDAENADVAKTVTKTVEYKEVEITSSNKSLTRLSQMFLQIFLTGIEPVSLPQASDLIHGKASSPAELVALGMKPGETYPTDSKTFQMIATRGFKTKIRRLYDIANVFLSIGLLRKSEYRRTGCRGGKRPHYHFQYHLSLQAIREAYDQLPANMIENQSPFSERQLRVLQVSSSPHPALNFFSEPSTNESTDTANSPLPLENASPSPGPHFESFSQPHRNSTDESTSVPDDVRSATAESPSSTVVSSVKIAEEDESSIVVGTVQSTPWTDVEESRTAKNFQVTPNEENSRSSEDQEEPCLPAMHVLGSRRNDSSPRRVSLSASSSSL